MENLHLASLIPEFEAKKFLAFSSELLHIMHILIAFVNS